MADPATLTALIDAYLATSRRSKTEFAKELGISRQSINRWDSAMPSPTSLRAVAAATGYPLSRVLAAALRSNGYITDTAEMITGQCLYIPMWDRDDIDGDHESDEFRDAGTGFTNPDAAHRYAAIANGIAEAPGQFRIVEIVVDDTHLPAAISSYRTTWSSHDDTFDQVELFSKQTPARLTDTGTSGITGYERPGTDRYFMLTVDSLDPDHGRQTLTAAVRALRTQGRLADTHAPSTTPVPAQPPSPNDDLAAQRAADRHSLVEEWRTSLDAAAARVTANPSEHHRRGDTATPNEVTGAKAITRIYPVTVDTNPTKG